MNVGPNPREVWRTLASRAPTAPTDTRGPKEVDETKQKERQPYYTKVDHDLVDGIQTNAGDLGTLASISMTDAYGKDGVPYNEYLAGLEQKKQQAKRDVINAVLKENEENAKGLEEVSLADTFGKLAVGTEVKTHYMRPGGRFSDLPIWGKVVKIEDGKVDVKFKNSFIGTKRNLPTAAIKEIKLAGGEAVPLPAKPDAPKTGTSATAGTPAPAPQAVGASEIDTAKPVSEIDAAKPAVPAAKAIRVKTGAEAAQQFEEIKKTSRGQKRLVRRRAKPKFDADGRMVSKGDMYQKSYKDGNITAKPYDHKGNKYGYDVHCTAWHGWNRDGTNINYKDRRDINFQEKSKHKRLDHVVPRTYDDDYTRTSMKDRRKYGSNMTIWKKESYGNEAMRDTTGSYYHGNRTRSHLPKNLTGDYSKGFDAGNI